ncbi:hypothetical protein EON81_06550 [bacterium]|nr:MAG: hypothetical protein EON81_06550 [bacterium]
MKSLKARSLSASFQTFVVWNEDLISSFGRTDADSETDLPSVPSNFPASLQSSLLERAWA